MWVKKLALSLAALLVSLLGAELLVRMAGAAPEVSLIRKGRFQLSRNPKIGFEPVPQLDYQGEELSFYDYQGASNSLGYRDTEHTVAKPPGVYRILVLGDSIAAGLRVERYEDVFPPVLEKILRQRGVNAEALNFSVSGYNTQQEVETLKDRGLRYRPDLVIVAYSLTDRERVDGDILATLLANERQKSGGNQVNAARANPYLIRSALYRFFKYRVFARHEAPGEDAGKKQLDLVSGDTVAESFGELRRLSQEHRFEVLVAVFPRLIRNFGHYRWGSQHQFVAGLSRQNGFHHLDLLDPLARCRAASDEPIGADNFHPSAVGHRCAAEAMAEAILREVRPKT